MLRNASDIESGLLGLALIVDTWLATAILAQLNQGTPPRVNKIRNVHFWSVGVAKKLSWKGGRDEKAMSWIRMFSDSIRLGST